jgi:hypothetical protein
LPAALSLFAEFIFLSLLKRTACSIFSVVDSSPFVSLDLVSVVIGEADIILESPVSSLEFF